MLFKGWCYHCQCAWAPTYVCLFVVGYLIGCDGGAGFPKLKLSLKLILTHWPTVLNSSDTDPLIDFQISCWHLYDGMFMMERLWSQLIGQLCSIHLVLIQINADRFPNVRMKPQKGGKSSTKSGRVEQLWMRRGNNQVLNIPWISLTAVSNKC